MPETLNASVAVVGIDIGKNSFHVVGHDERGAIVLRQKWSLTRLLQTSTFNSEQIQELVAAYESALASLNLTDRTDPLTELIAKAIMEGAKTGELDRAKLRDCALAAVKRT